MATISVIGACLLLLCLLAVRAWRIFQPRPSFLDHPVIFFGLAFTAMLALRWTSISLVAQVNIDESQMIAQGMRFASHPIPWRDVDGTTSGPLNSMLLSIPIKLGSPATWETSRLVHLVVQGVVLVLIYLTLRFLLPRAEAQFALLPLIFFYAFVRDGDFTHYASETLPSLLIAGSVYLLARTWARNAVSGGLMFALGVLLGAVPFAKLQAAPLVAYLALVGAALIFAQGRRGGKTTGQIWIPLLCLALGLVAVPALILGVVAANGAFGDFWMSYIVATKKYAGAETLRHRVKHLIHVLLRPWEFFSFFTGALASIGVLFLIWRERAAKAGAKLCQLLAMTAIYCVLAILCFFAAGKAFNHYVSLFVPEVALFIGLVFVAGKTLIGLPGAQPAPKLRWLVLFTVVVVGAQSYKPLLRMTQTVRRDRFEPPPKQLAIVNAIRALSRPGDTMSIWGWSPEYYVRTGLAPATRDAIGHYMVSSGPYKDYYRQRHLRDLMADKPTFFVDTVADGEFLSWELWTTANSHEAFPELAKYVDANYRLVGKFQMDPKVDVGPIRLYVSKQRMAELHLSPLPADAPPVMDSH